MIIENARLWIKVLERVEAERLPFYMDTWWTKCGTAGCGLGWLAHSPEGQAAGWSFTAGSADIANDIPTYQGKHTCEFGVNRFLGIRIRTAYSIIYSSQYHFPERGIRHGSPPELITPRDVINRIQEIIERNTEAKGVAW